MLLLFVVVAALALGDSRRERGRAIAERDETRRAMQDTLEDQAAMGERARIARDLHDIVAHHVSAIAVEAETARLTTKRLPKEGARALRGDRRRRLATRSTRCADCSASCVRMPNGGPSACRSPGSPSWTS